MQCQIYYGVSGLSEHINFTLKAGETKILIEIPSGNYHQIRFDIGSEAGLSYKILHLGVLATDGQANNDDIILEVKGTVGLSGIMN